MEAMNNLQAYAPWLVLAALGGYHGLNPAMGWLFAVSLGLQERSRRAVLGAFGPIVLGHALSIGLVVALVALAQNLIAPDTLAAVSAFILLGFGVFKLLAPNRHPRWVGMRVNNRDLTVWSFLMATAHGAGLMLIPILFQLPATARFICGTDHVLLMPLADLAAVGLHTLAMFAVMALIAVLVFEKLGLAILRQAWFNVDWLWVISLLLTGVLSLVLM